MPFVDCPACHGRVNVIRDTCPRCGEAVELPPKSKRLALLALAVCVVVGLVTAASIARALAVALAPAPTHPGGREILTREEFTAACLGKTEEEIHATLGSPDKTTSSGEARAWIYYDRTYDRVSRKRDGIALVHFFGSKVCGSVTY